MIKYLEIINMHGYGIYVWPCYIISSILISYNILKPIILHKKAVKILKSNIDKKS
tara:strand:- start:3898 stop:4062 length:165 start_codon:yes stop_codon:yes gene_type:complete